MKLCIPTKTDDGKAAKVHEHFGSAPYFVIYDTETDTAEVINNINQHHSHGMCQPLSSLGGKKIDAVVCSGMGARAVQKLNEGGIRAFRAIPGTVENIASQFLKGSLKEITAADACTQHGCH